MSLNQQILNERKKWTTERCETLRADTSLIADNINVITNGDTFYLPYNNSITSDGILHTVGIIPILPSVELDSIGPTPANVSNTLQLYNTAGYKVNTQTINGVQLNATTGVDSSGSITTDILTTHTAGGSLTIESGQSAPSNLILDNNAGMTTLGNGTASVVLNYNSTTGTTTLAPTTSGSITLTLPATTDTLVGRATTDTLTNKSLSDSTTKIINASTASKVLAFSTSGSSASTTLTLTTAQTTSQSLAIPNVGSGDTILTANTFSGPTLSSNNTWTGTNTFEDSKFSILNALDSTKSMVFDNSLATTNTSLIIGNNQSISARVNIPNLSGTDTFATLGLSQTWTGTPAFPNISLTNNTNQILFDSPSGFQQTLSVTVPSANTTVTLPDFGGNDSLVGLNATQTLSHKKLIAGTTTIVDAIDNTKVIRFDCSNNATGKILTILSKQTNSETLDVPDIPANGDTIATLKLANVFTSTNTFAQIIDSGLSPSLPVYTNGSNQLVSGTGTIVTTYSTPGTFTWTQNAFTKQIIVYIWAGGSGGGSGRQGATTFSGGGGGGAGSGLLVWNGPASFFGSTETVIVGSGGAGGVPQTSATSNGNNGGGMSPSSFGNIQYLILSGQHGGNGGTTINANGGGIVDPSVVSLGGSHPGQTGGAGQASAPGNNSNLVNICSTGGGGGSGANSGTAQQAGNGASLVAIDQATVVLAAGLGGIETGTINGTNGNSGVTTHGLFTGGTGGGGGGGQSTGLVAGNGGNGGNPGGGGGGGGGSLNGTNSGAGGNGGNGQVIVVEIM
jgi:hypothetical protein